MDLERQAAISTHFSFSTLVPYSGTGDESILGIHKGPRDPVGIPREWESLIWFYGNRNENDLVGIEGNEKFTCSHFLSVNYY